MHMKKNSTSCYIYHNNFSWEW